jgi:hypothetical protein
MTALSTPVCIGFGKNIEGKSIAQPGLRID